MNFPFYTQPYVLATVIMSQHWHFKTDPTPNNPGGKPSSRPKCDQTREKVHNCCHALCHSVSWLILTWL